MIAGRIARARKPDPSHDKRPDSKDDPSKKWCHRFLTRHKVDIKLRKASNIKKDRTKVDEEDIKKWHSNITPELEGVPPQNITDFDETNFT